MQEEKENDDGPEGCYLVYESDSGGKLMLVYSRGTIPDNAVGFWCPGEGESIQGFKFKQAGGRSELIKGIAGGDSNRRKYFSGWCQFIKLAYQKKGKLIKFPNSDQGVEVDVYGFSLQDDTPTFLDLDERLVDVHTLDAVAVVPRHNVNFQGVHTLAQSNFLDRGNLAGSATMLK
jgi:Immune Mapped Protein 2 (IMP2) N-terminal domain